MRDWKAWRPLPLLVAAAAMVPVDEAPAQGQGPKQHEWSGMNSSSWNDEQNWSTSEKPEAGDIVLLNGKRPGGITGVPPISLLRIELQDGTVVRGGDGGEGEIRAATAVISPGDYYVKISAPSIIVLGDGDKDDAFRCARFIGAQAGIESSGLTTVSAGACIDLADGAAIVNTGEWLQVAGTGEVRGDSCCTRPSRFENAGRIGGRGVMALQAVALEVLPGSIVETSIWVEGGLLLLGGRSTLGGRNGQLGAWGTTEVRRHPRHAGRPALQLNSGLGFGSGFLLAGGRLATDLILSGPAGNPGQMTWLQGTILRPLTVGRHVQLSITSQQRKVLELPEGAGELRLEGSTEISGDATVEVAGTIRNLGTFRVRSGPAAVLQGRSCCTVPYRFLNEGTLDASTAPLRLAGLGLTSQGSGSRLGGEIVLSGGHHVLRDTGSSGTPLRLLVRDRARVTASGRITLDADSSWDLAGNSQLLAPAAMDFAGRGRVQWGSGTWSGTILVGKDTRLWLVQPGEEPRAERILNGESSESVLTVEGETAQDASLHLAGANAQAMVRNAGRWTLQSGDLTGTSASAFISSGRLTANRRGGTVRLATGRFESTGELLVEAGTLQIHPRTDPVAAGGTVEVRRDAVLDVRNRLELRGASLSGPGLVRGGVLNAGTVRPPEQGVLKIEGDYEQAPAGTLEVKIAGGGASRLEISGAARLAGTLDITGGRTRANDVLVLEAREGREGEFDTLRNDAGVTIREKYVFERVWLEVQ